MECVGPLRRSPLAVFTSAVDLGSDGAGGRVADGRVGGAGSTGRQVLLGSGTDGQGCSGQVGVRANARTNAAASSLAQGQVSGILILRLRWPRTIRAAVCSSR